MSDVKLEDAEHLARSVGAIRAMLELSGKPLLAGDCERAAALLRKIPELLERERRLREMFESEQSLVDKLQNALSFWLPGVPSDDPEIADRAGDDARLLYACTSPITPSAEQLGWVKLRAALAQPQADAATPVPALYYLQYSGTVVGNSALWWRHGGHGYTCNLNEAGVFTEERAFAQHRCRDLDVPRLKTEMEALSKRYVDIQDLARAQPQGERP